MNKSYLEKELANLGPALRTNRQRVSNLVLETPELLPFLIEIVFEIKNKTSTKAAWVLELVCADKLDWLAPHLDYFIENIGIIEHDSAVRPISKICNFLAISYNSKKKSVIKIKLTSNHIEKIIETGFDWMISQHKVATKAYTMNTLFLLGKNHNWVHEELKLIILQNISKESAAYKARGRITLALINKQ